VTDEETALSVPHRAYPHLRGVWHLTEGFQDQRSGAWILNTGASFSGP
jgi:hypothetical protein